MAPEFKVTYKVKYSDSGEPLIRSLNIIEPTQEKAIGRVERMLKRNVFEHYPQIIEINAERLNDSNPRDITRSPEQKAAAWGFCKPEVFCRMPCN